MEASLTIGKQPGAVETLSFATQRSGNGAATSKASANAHKVRFLARLQSPVVARAGKSECCWYILPGRSEPPRIPTHWIGLPRTAGGAIRRLLSHQFIRESKRWPLKEVPGRRDLAVPGTRLPERTGQNRASETVPYYAAD